jgi:G3E family GTPase
MSQPVSPLACHLITGPLGVGKTTAIIDYLKRHAATQFVAVLVNDFGPVGLDAAIIESDTSTDSGAPKPRIMMVPGGCICCSAAAGLLEGFQELSKLSRKPDRVIVEPSGIALVGDTVDLLRSFSEQFNVELRPVVTMIDPKLLNRPAFTRLPYFIRMIESADVLVANRCDLSPRQDIERFEKWAAELYPPGFPTTCSSCEPIPRASPRPAVSATRSKRNTNASS